MHSITQETRIDADEIEIFLRLYREAFDPLEELSPLRQSMTDAEFRDEMVHESVIKLVAWDDAGKPAAILCVTNDFERIPWLNPRYYAVKFPEHFARRAIYFYGSLLVHPERQGMNYAGQLMAESSRVVVPDGGIIAFDCCQFNVDVVQLPEMIASVCDRVCFYDRIELDAQHFYAYVTHGFRPEYQTPAD